MKRLILTLAAVSSLATPATAKPPRAVTSLHGHSFGEALTVFKRSEKTAEQVRKREWMGADCRVLGATWVCGYAFAEDDTLRQFEHLRPARYADFASTREALIKLYGKPTTDEDDECRWRPSGIVVTIQFNREKQQMWLIYSLATD